MEFFIENMGTISIAGGLGIALYFIIRFTKRNSDNNSNSGNVTINQKGGNNSGHIASGRDTNIKK